MPLGFYYPGSGTSGDLPPRHECAPLWHHQLLEKMKSVQLTILIGQYSQKFYLREKLKSTLTETVKSFKEYLPQHLLLVHASSRNKIWQKKNPWFESVVVPQLRKQVSIILG